MRYDTIYTLLANRAIAQGMVDLETFVAQMVGLGASPEHIEGLLLQDLETNGPIFGKFFRSLRGAATASVANAGNQGAMAGRMLTKPKTMERYFPTDTLEDVTAAIQNAGPETLERIEQTSDDMPLMWQAMLKDTCHRCLPLHGRVLYGSQWKERGLHPSTIHGGWQSDCHCRLIPQEETEGGLKDQTAVLVRNKDVTGLRGGKKTVRGLTQYDIEKAIDARNKALQSEEGRRILRRLGQTVGGE
jgi:hypothetical protein